jgi:PTS system nitrogen regulatory IIA component
LNGTKHHVPEFPDLMTARELAEYLRLNERTVLKLAAQGELPSARLGNQWRFRRAIIDAWLQDQMLGIRPGSDQASTTPPTFSFQEGFRPGHVIERLKASAYAGVLEEMCARAHDLGLIRDKTWFLGALIERENVLPSTVGDEVAFPHTLRRHPEHVTRPFLLLGRSTIGVDFTPPSGRLVHIVVLMGLRFEELHLPWLARLSNVLRRADVRSQLLAASDGNAIHELVVEELGREPI